MSFLPRIPVHTPEPEPIKTERIPWNPRTTSSHFVELAGISGGNELKEFTNWFHELRERSFRFLHRRVYVEKRSDAGQVHHVLHSMAQPNQRQLTSTFVASHKGAHQ
jgi:hypothetical protein